MSRAFSMGADDVDEMEVKEKVSGLEVSRLRSLSSLTNVPF